MRFYASAVRFSLFLSKNFCVNFIYSYIFKPNVKLWINNREVESKATEFIDLFNPATNEVIGRVPKSTNDEMETAVQSCKQAYKSWSKTTPLYRQQIMFKLQSSIRSAQSQIICLKQISVNSGVRTKI